MSIVRFSLFFDRRKLQESRDRSCGTWVKCCRPECGKWRLLRDLKDPAIIPSFWSCSSSDGGSRGGCSAPQEAWESSDEEGFVENRFGWGSVVWARLTGLPWWPAMVDDDPNVEQFFWTEADSDAVTSYHVVFFDGPGRPVQRAWVPADKVKRFREEGEDGEERELPGNKTMAAPPSRRLITGSLVR